MENKNINILDMCDKVFYTKENGEVFECFKNKQMKVSSNGELNDLIMNGRQKQISFVSIAEQQVNELKNIFKDKSLRKIAVKQSITLKSYADYKIISNEEFKELMELLQS
ncbi:hypothetical protein OD350_28815 (plasmid) [Clostridium beijerinckii]|uniref:hypothetical protein n=1 Tax=Clostridium beijerinckii TaxID=1520 RepID=UPI002227EAD3|nr:hypothetical protein [Clostridium beijerinckii]UYZ39077.1 hypothetical protein OD350_28815 [Clostridium beijerinckii]